MAELERELEREVRAREEDLLYGLGDRKMRLQLGALETQEALQRGIASLTQADRARQLASAPVIYAMILPIAFLDLAVSIYQALCFPLYRVAKVERRQHVVIDRHLLRYLNLFEKLHCIYCGYANGVLSFASEVAARTEQYWCPIKHARRARGSHAHYASFLAYGDSEAYRSALPDLRAELEPAPSPAARSATRQVSR